MTTEVTIKPQVQSKPQVKPAFSALAQNVASLAFGAIVIFAVGFLPMEAAHNAAHDTRHAVTFPCH